MNGLLSIWEGSDPRQRLVALLAGLAALLALGGLASVALKPNMSLLYAGLDQSAAGAVVTALESRGVQYEVRGDGIFVEEGRRDAMRMALAADGLPESGAAGYELLDALSGFGTTAEMFDAAYWRAKEGELARTIVALPTIRRARVHIANPVRRPFERGSEPTASVVVTTIGGALPGHQAEAIRFLVGSAVAGLQMQNVSVIDAERGIALRAGEEGAGTAAEGEDRAEAMRRNVERLLGARVGPESVIVEVSLDTDRNAEKITERVLDPESRVAVSTDTEETSAESTGGAGGGVTVASNLPDGDVETDGGGGASSNSTRSRERVNYEVSEVLRERTRNPGEIRRISVAVLVDGLRETAADGTETWTARPEEELQALRALVESAIGFDAARGDTISIQTMQFARGAEAGEFAEAGAGGFLAANAMTLIQLVVLALVTLALILFVLRPMMQPAPRSGAIGSDEESLQLGADPLGNVERSIEAAGDLIDAEGVGVDKLAALRDAVQERPEDSAFLLRSWLESDDKTGKAA
ncbi:flagellar basal-body MS-ring/collar protein FliF [Rhodovulum sp. DZ06]|uniref:flagellar basal-body MS-ring/collar protein FliF n=1 Tax=Rhodovulum sp. DZ06 TaxID=3425126 RepID=UPI003D336FC1